MAELIFLGVDSGRSNVDNGWRFRFSVHSCMGSVHLLLGMMDDTCSDKPDRAVATGGIYHCCGSLVPGD